MAIYNKKEKIMQSETSPESVQEIINQFAHILSGKNKEIKDAEAVLGILQ